VRPDDGAVGPARGESRSLRRRSVPAGLARLNIRRSRGRFAILILLLTAAVLARSAGSLAQTGLEARTARAAPETARPTTTLALLWWPGAEFSVSEADKHLCSYLTGGISGTAAVNYPEPIWAWAETVFGPAGGQTLVRLHPGSRERGIWRCWFERLEGRLPDRPSEVLIPEGLATEAGLAVGDEMTLVRCSATAGRLPAGDYHRAGDAGLPGQMTVTVSGIYSPVGSGPAFSCILSVPEPGRGEYFNMVGPRDERTLAGFKAWMNRVGTLGYPLGPPALSLPLVVGATRPTGRAAELARGIFGSQASSTVGFGLSLVGLAVLIILLVSLHERRREMATYKLVGMDNVRTTQVLAAELGLALGLATLLAALAYGPLAVRYIPDVFAGGGGGAAAALFIFLESLVWTAGVTALSAIYPMAMVSAATPMQLLTGQKVFLFRRRRVLPGWTDFEGSAAP